MWSRGPRWTAQRCKAPARQCVTCVCVGVAMGLPPFPLQSGQVYLNGALLSVDPSTGLLPQRPIPGGACAGFSAASASVTMAAYTYGFYTFSGTPAACA